MTQRTHTWNCQRCGKACERIHRGGMPPKYCGDQCQRAAYRAPRFERTCERCGSAFTAWEHDARTCSRSCRAVLHGTPKGPPPSAITTALRAGDHVATLSAIRVRVRVSGSGCWVWQGRIEGGYPYIDANGRKNVRVHRLALDAKLGGKLGRLPAHHMCSNTACVNPDHLQPVTARENNAEMMARRAYRERIAELETALHQVAPDHPLLSVLSIA